MTTKELLKGCDVHFDRMDLNDLTYKAPLTPLPQFYPVRVPQWAEADASTPENGMLDLLRKYAPLARNQKVDGPCTGYALAAMINYLKWSRCWRRQVLSAVPLDNEDIPSPSPDDAVSPEMLYQLARHFETGRPSNPDPAKDYELGSKPKAAMKGWHKFGVCLEKHWPKPLHTKGFKLGDEWRNSAGHCTMAAYYRVWDTFNQRTRICDIQAAIYESGAVYVSGKINLENWNKLKHDGKQPETVPTIAIDTNRPQIHAYTFVGFDPVGFILLNSWGENFGYHGFARLPYEEWINSGEDAWVASLGVPFAPGKSGGADVTRESKAGVVSRSRAFGAPDPVLVAGRGAWTEEEAYHHSLIFNDYGGPLNRLVDQSDGKTAIHELFHNRVIEHFGQKKNAAVATTKKQLTDIVIFAQSGLEREEHALRRAAVLGPVFYKNGIYPIFVSAEGGFMEPLGQLLLTGLHMKKSVLGEDMDKALQAIRDAWVNAPGRVSEGRDQQLEGICQRLVRPLWTQFKQTTAVAADLGGALYQLAAKIEDAVANPVLGRSTGIHLVGHSAGAIVLGHLLARLHSLRVKVETCTLMAPACSIDFALEHFVGVATPRSKKNQHVTLKKNSLWIHMLSDEFERKGIVGGVYGKSLLYLMSRALEDQHRTPLLGMEEAWRTKPEEAESIFGYAGALSIKEWKKSLWGKYEPVNNDEVVINHKRRRFEAVVHNEQQIRVSASGEQVNAAHELFDNNADLIEQTIKRILKMDQTEELAHRVQTLKGF